MNCKITKRGFSLRFVYPSFFGASFFCFEVAIMDAIVKFNDKRSAFEN